MSLPALNLPAYDLDVAPDTRGRLTVTDPLRRKRVVLTPEEWVRQHFVRYLVGTLGYPPLRMANEVGISLNGTLKRCDTVVYDGYMQPLVIVEYKAPHIALTQKVFEQIARYNLVMGAPWLIVSNGMQHFSCRYDRRDDGATSVVFSRQIPLYQQVTGASD